MREAERAFAAGQHTVAEALLRRLLASAPATVAAWNLLGEILNATDRAAASDAWWHALSLDPNNAEASFHLGNRNREQGEHGAAVIHYERALHGAPAHAGLLNNLGLSYKALGAADRAETCYRAALDAQPQHIDALVNLANALFQRKEYAEVITTADRLLALQPNAPASIRLLRALAQERIGDVAGAESTLREAIQRWPEDATLHAHLGTLLVHSRRYADIHLAASYEELSEPQFTHGRDLLTLLAPKTGERVLDIGCGTGRLTSTAADLVAEDGYVLGIDPAPGRIDIARRRVVPQLEYRVGRAENLSSIESGAFHVAYLNSVLNWIAEKERALHEVFRLLKPGGRLGIGTTVLDRRNELWQLARKAWNAVAGQAAGLQRYDTPPDERDARGSGGPDGRSRVTIEETRALVQRAGFVLRIFDNRTYRSHFTDVAQMIEFLQATTYDNFLPATAAAEGDRFHAAFEQALTETIPVDRRANGIDLERYVLLVVADKPA